MTGVANNEIKLPWFGTVRSRLGFMPSDRWLVYATGGFAYGEIDSNTTLSTGAASLSMSSSSIRLGLAVGGGIEWAFWEQWTTKVEYLYVDFGTINISFAGIAPFTPITTSTHVTDNIIRFGVNHRFGGR